MKIIKMQAYGNDFCLTPFENNVDYKELAKKVLDRRLGVGGLGLIVVKIEPNLEMFIYDSIGNKAMMDSNALLCFSKYVYENKLIRKKEFNVIMSNAKYIVEAEDDSYVLNNFALSVNGAKSLYQYVLTSRYDDSTNLLQAIRDTSSYFNSRLNKLISGDA